MSVSGEYVLLPEEFEILKEINSISNKELTNFQYMQVAKNLNSIYPHVRVKCLSVIGQYLDPLSHFPRGTSNIFDIVQWYTQDNDSRVRETAFGLYLNWAERGLLFPDFGLVYDLLQSGLNDSENEVVITCLKLVVKMANIQPDYEIISGSKQKSRMADKSFCCVAVALSHASSSVRRHAATLLSSIRDVSEILMLETLEKTVMKDKIIKKSLFDRTNAINKLYWIDEMNNNFAKKSAKSCQQQVDSPEEAMAMGGINGALIYGLEDDFYEIRLETIRTIGKLSLQSDKFAISCQDLLVDMLTDDIEVVRSNSVLNLSIASGIKQHMMLRTDQLDIVLSILSEKSGNIRRSIHQLLSSCRLASAHALMRLVDGLLKNLRTYEIDRDSIWTCSAKVGRNHPELVQVNLNLLLQMHPYLVFQDPSKSDSGYVTVLLMVINASRQLPSIKTSFPTHVKTNEIYLSELVPDLIFKTQAADSLDSMDEPKAKQAKFDEAITSVTASTANPISDDLVSRQDLYSYLTDTIRTLYKVIFESGPPSHCTSNLMRLLLQDLRQISGLCDETRGSCLWLRDLGQLYRLTQQMPMVLNRLQEGRYLAHKMIYAYTGIHQTDIDHLKAFIQDIDLKIKCIREQNIIPTRETKEILSTCPPISHLKSISLLTGLDPSSSLDQIHSTLSRINQVTAKQLHPTSYDTERSAHKFCAGMSVSLSVRAEFSGLDVVVDRNDAVCVRTPVAVIVNRPDGMSFFWQPPAHCWTSSTKRNDGGDDQDSSKLSSSVFFLDTEVPLSFNEWSEPGQVHLGLAVLLPNRDLTWKLTDPVGVKIYPICANKCL